MLLLGIDLGTSSIKISVVDHESQKTLASVSYPDEESPIQSAQAGWAEQDPNMWWEHIKMGIQKAHSKGAYNPNDIKYIGIAYQMHGLVLLDSQGNTLRNAIIWCDSRAVPIGQKAFRELGEQAILQTHLNSPGNFTASKFKWVQENEPEIYRKTKHLLLPGDFVSYRLTGEYCTTHSALSEGVLWDFSKNSLSKTILDHYKLDTSVIPAIHPVFDDHGRILPTIADELGLAHDVHVTYKAGDQPNNALSLNVMQAGEVAATAGTSGVIYGVSDDLVYDKQSRVNTFAHVNHREDATRTGVLLCINGTGILYNWIRKIAGGGLSYDEINQIAAEAPVGAQDLRIFPFGNGAERMLNDRMIQASIMDIDFNRHDRASLFRAAQEGIAFAFRYGLDIMRENGMIPKVIRAGHANLFRSAVFRSSFVATTNTPLELYQNDGSVGAALGAGIGAHAYRDAQEALGGLQRIADFAPEPVLCDQYEALYQGWKEELIKKLNIKKTI
ncbi:MULTISPECIES: xylulokinase [Sphingobacterium]|uniref:Xylulokinase n=1 Tax=Sphingobacterium populi TaxID=1812824 RepID=A0ABW5UBV7_9SPHI|nr:FGGY family carbohydrate kinase [Sphingobacterium sp. CFCC 11742]